MKDAPDLIAKIRLLPTSAGGRSSPTPEDKLNCILTFGDRNFDVRIHLGQTGSLQPGQEATVPISFYDPEFARDFIAVGQEFKLREQRVIGEGQIEEIRLHPPVAP
jgi:hypothetical protein